MFKLEEAAKVRSGTPTPSYPGVFPPYQGTWRSESSGENPFQVIASSSPPPILPVNMGEISAYITHCGIQDPDGELETLLYANSITDATYFATKHATYEELKKMALVQVAQ